MIRGCDSHKSNFLPLLKTARVKKKNTTMWKVNVGRYIFLRWLWPTTWWNGATHDRVFDSTIFQRLVLAREDVSYMFCGKHFFREPVSQSIFVWELCCFLFRHFGFSETSLHQYNRCLNVAIQALQWGELCWQNRPNGWLLRHSRLMLDHPGGFLCGAPACAS